MTEKTVLEKLSSWCSSAERCEEEVIKKMQRWAIPSDMQERVLACLRENRFLDEARYCQAFTHDKFHYQKWGRIKIAAALKVKKIDPYLIEEALSSIDAAEYIQTLEKLLHSKNKSIREVDEFTRNAKLYRFALVRGFESSLIRKIVQLDGFHEMD